MTAVVTLKLAPADFDLLRKSLALYQTVKALEGEDGALAPKVRRDAKVAVSQADDLARKLGRLDAA